MNSEWIVIIFSTAALLAGAGLWQKATRLTLHGKKTTAILFSNNYKSSGSKRGLYYPVIRFVTYKKMWITHEMSVGFTPALSPGRKFSIIYNPDDPHELNLNSTFIMVVLPRLLVTAGIGGLFYGLLIYLEYL